MDLAQLQHRVEELETKMALMQQHLDQVMAANGCGAKKEQPRTEEDEFIDGAEYDIVLNAPPKAEYPVTVRIIAVEEGPKTLALTDEEWAHYSQ